MTVSCYSNEFNSDHIHSHSKLGQLYIQIFTCSNLSRIFSQSHVSFIWMGSGHYMIYIRSCHVWLWRMIVVFMKPAAIASFLQ